MSNDKPAKGIEDKLEDIQAELQSIGRTLRKIELVLLALQAGFNSIEEYEDGIIAIKKGNR